jgi:hypothetical protein
VTRIKYVAEVSPVREVSLRGVADVKPWREPLGAVRLEPAESDGRAVVMLSATDARFRGVRFREFSISVLARERDGGVEGWFLAHAFNSRRFFAWVERAWFSTPYYHARIAVDAGPPAAVEVGADDGVLCIAMSREMQGREPSRRGPESWHGPIFLPPRPGQPHAAPKLFYARLEGDALAFPFAADRDEIMIMPSEKWPIFGQLAATNFQPIEWLLRPAAVHAKSRTYDGPAFANVASQPDQV